MSASHEAKDAMLNSKYLFLEPSSRIFLYALQFVYLL
jgi:hypothetical protein